MGIFAALAAAAIGRGQEPLGSRCFDQHRPAVGQAEKHVAAQIGETRGGVGSQHLPVGANDHIARRQARSGSGLTVVDHQHQ